MWGPHSQSHVTLRYRGHVTNKKRYIFTFTRPMDPKLNWVVTYGETTSFTKSRDTSIMWSRVKSKTWYLHIHKTHSPKNLVGCWIRMRGPHVKCHVTMSRKTVIFPQLQGHRDVKEKLVLIKNKPKNVNRMLRWSRLGTSVTWSKAVFSKILI